MEDIEKDKEAVELLKLWMYIRDNMHWPNALRALENRINDLTKGILSR